MKRRLAFLLALSLTFASFPVAGAGATETTAATDTEVVTVVEQEENSGEGVSVEGETVDPTNEVKEETAGTSGTENSQETTQTKEETANTEAVSDESTTNENTGVVEDAAAGFTEDAATGLTDTEVAAVVEPEEVVAAEEVKQAAATTPATTTNKVQPHWVSSGGDWYYVTDTGANATGFLSVQGVRYYFYSDGKMATGWVYDAGSWYFCDTTTGKMRTGWLLDRGTWYFLYRDGSMATGWDLIGGKWYYFNSSGAMATGWVYSKGDWYYLSKNPTKLGSMVTHWQKIDNIRYYFDPSSGAMASAPRYCVDVNGERKNDYYFFYGNGSLGTGKGWKKNGGYWYYTNADGILYRNTTVEGYHLDGNGRWADDSMDTKAQGYSSNTNYLILCDKTKFKVRVYKGSKGNWTQIKDWDCTHGGSDTPNGVFTIDDHVTKRDATWGWADFDFSSAAFACHISAGNYFHSILFDKGTRGNPYNQRYRILDDQLRTTYSHGCIRLKLENAEWVWDNIPFGTKVVVYNS